MKALVTKTAAEATKIIIVCILALAVFFVSLWMCNSYKKVIFSPPLNEPGAAGSSSVAPVHIMSTMDLQRELNRRYPKEKLVVDGKCGPQTQALWDRAYNQQCALETWPEDSE